ncbi:polysaccharide deacetylase family protein [Rhodococcus opacus]|uniref:polysaccharide deacetylase family protein n=1 Tax=Rhodococcus opacus TaxID=37919 RepID=UPI002953E2C8|nr:polysaccharide deacetylase family protein [Rhodococcus opacus]MDV7088354.1 polysaccharide deacetylase family protein [Rhodococcus opacus]
MNARSYQLFGTLVDRVDTDEKVVALTFDDGPTSRTPEVLRLLNEADIRATFYLNGTDLRANPEHGRRIGDAGHELGNHTDTHRRMVFVSADTVRDEIERKDEAIRAAGYTGPITVRPLYGKKLLGLPHYLAEHDRTTVMWDVEPDSAATADTAGIVAATLAQTRPGSIILMHVMFPSRQASLDAVPEVVAGLTAEGYRFVTVSKLLES